MVTLVTSALPFAEMIRGVVYTVSMDQVGITQFHTLFTFGFGPCMVVVVHHPMLRAGGLAHLIAPFVRDDATAGMYVRDHVSQILGKIRANPASRFDVVLIEGAWGQSADTERELRSTFRECNVVDRRDKIYRQLSGVVLYDPQTGKVAHYNDRDDEAQAKATPYAGVLRARAMVSPYPAWQPDDKAAACNKCRTTFGLFTRRHHCRMCGLIFCSGCSSKTTKVTYPASPNQKELSKSIGVPVRVCDRCFAG